MSNTAREFSHAAKNWLQLLPQKYRVKTLHQSLWGEIHGRRSCRSYSELRKHKIVEEEDIGVVSTKICRSCCLHDGILHDRMQVETLKIHLQKASEVSPSLALTASQWSSLQFLLWCVRLKLLFLEHCQPAISTVYCFLFSVFRLNSSMRNKTETHVFWENGVYYPRVFPSAHSFAFCQKSNKLAWYKFISCLFATGINLLLKRERRDSWREF